MDRDVLPEGMGPVHTEPQSQIPMYYSLCLQIISNGSKLQTGPWSYFALGERSACLGVEKDKGMNGSWCYRLRNYESKCVQGGTAISSVLTSAPSSAPAHLRPCRGPFLGLSVVGPCRSLGSSKPAATQNCSTDTVLFSMATLSCADRGHSPADQETWGSLGREFGTPAHWVLSTCALFPVSGRSHRN